MFKKFKQYFGPKTRDNALPDNKDLIGINNWKEESETKVDIPGSVPTEIFYEILMYLSPSDLHSMWNCCRMWRNNIESFCKRKCKIENYFECEDNLNSKLYQKFIAKYSQWHGMYMYNSLLESNWIKGNCKKILVNYKIKTFMPCKELSYFSGDVFIITNNKKNTIVVIDSTTGLIKQNFRLKGPKYNNLNIRQVGKFENGIIVVSESRGGDSRVHIKVWNIETGTSLMEFELEMDRMVKVIIYENLVSVITHRNVIHIINIKKKKLEYRKSHIRSIFHCSDKIAMGTDVGTIILINLDYIELMEINCFESDCRIDDIQINGKYLIGLSQNGNADDFRACIWNLERKMKLYEIGKLLKEELRIYVNENRLAYAVCGYKKQIYGNIMKYCHLDTGDCIFTFDEYSVISTTHDLFILHEDFHDPIKNRRVIELRSVKSDNIVGRLSLPEYHYSWISTIWKTKSRLAYLTEYVHMHPTLHIVNFEAKMKI